MTIGCEEPHRAGGCWASSAYAGWRLLAIQTAAGEFVDTERGWGLGWEEEEPTSTTEQIKDSLELLWFEPAQLVWLNIRGQPRLRPEQGGDGATCVNNERAQHPNRQKIPSVEVKVKKQQTQGARKRKKEGEWGCCDAAMRYV